MLAAGDLRLDPASRRAWRGDVELVAGRDAREFSLLEVLIRHPGRVIGRFELLEHVWDQSYEHRSNVIEVYVGYLRDKVDRPFDRRTIETVRGAGYRLRAEELMRPPRAVRRAVNSASARFDRMPIRLKLALAFAGVMVALFGLLFLLIYIQFAGGLDDGIRSSLQARAADLTAIARENDQRLRPSQHATLPSGSGFRADPRSARPGAPRRLPARARRR